ncbi:MAG: HNH endonuclease [Oscillospiraceae bacterium]|nr:HNH endonuclease [Oscillospiraceae bacterium]
MKSLQADKYVCKKEVDWSLLMAGLAVPVENQVVFGQIMGRFIQRGESKDIKLILNGNSFSAKLYNLDLDPRHNRIKDMMQIRYPRSGDLARELQAIYHKTFQYIRTVRESRDKNDRRRIQIPEEMKEYLAVYTTEYDDSYVLEPITAEEIAVLREHVNGQTERTFEAEFDEDADLIRDTRMMSIRRLNKRIGENLKLLYGYRCQICGKLIGEEFGSHIAETHHIDYFVNSLNNDSSNQMIVCPNHHSIIHDANPVFDRGRMLYLYPNGTEQRLVLNKHL